MYGHLELSSLSRAPMLSLHLLFLSYSGVQELSSLFLSHEPPAAPAGATSPPPQSAHHLSYPTQQRLLPAPSTSYAPPLARHGSAAASTGAHARAAPRPAWRGWWARTAPRPAWRGRPRAAPRVAWRGQLGEGLARGEFADGTSRQIEGVRTGSLALVGESQPNIQRAEKRLYVLGARAGAIVSRDDGLSQFSS